MEYLTPRALPPSQAVKQSSLPPNTSISQTNLYRENISENIETFGQTEFAVSKAIHVEMSGTLTIKSRAQEGCRVEIWEPKDEVIRLENTALKDWCWGGSRTLRNIYMKSNLVIQWRKQKGMARGRNWNKNVQYHKCKYKKETFWKGDNTWKIKCLNWLNKN